MAASVSCVFLTCGFINRASRPYYLFFYYLSYYLYGEPGIVTLSALISIWTREPST